MATLHPRHMMLFGAGTWLLSSLAVNTRFGLFSRRTLTAFGAHEACASRCTVSDKFGIALRERINHQIRLLTGTKLANVPGPIVACPLGAGCCIERGEQRRAWIFLCKDLIFQS